MQITQRSRDTNVQTKETMRRDLQKISILESPVFGDTCICWISLVPLSKMGNFTLVMQVMHKSVIL